MTALALPAVPAIHLARVRNLLQDGRRKLLGLVGPPGAGKSTLAMALQHAFPESTQIVSMDGFHLANAELRRLGRSESKGSPDTFDSAGYAELLQRLRLQSADEIVYAPEFCREIDESVAGAVPVSPRTRLLITEGNYLLVETGHWARVAPLLDDIWYVDVEDALRTDRLIQRHELYGRSREDAVDWVAATDAPNAGLIAATRPRAKLIFRWDDARLGTAFPESGQRMGTKVGPDLHWAKK
jgi:pantothenate kinase